MPRSGCDEDEHDRHAPSPSVRSVVLTSAGAARALGDEAGDREDAEELAELGGLEREEADVDPAGRAACRAAEDEDDGDQADGRREDRAPVAAVDVRVDDHRDDQREAADGHIEDLPVEVVVGCPGSRSG